jgi:large subunit ribosomal protein L22
MTGPKTNEGATTVGERTGTRAVARYVRVSATKAREVLDLIRGLDVAAADDVLRFVERDVAIVVRKVLASAVANAQNNDAQDPDELKVVACFADEGPTLKRFRPRARGRATRVRKRTCHITVIVGRMSERELEQRDARESARQGGRRPGRGAAAAAAARRERVARSRRAAGATPEAEATAAEETTSEATDVEASEVETTDVDDTATGAESTSADEVEVAADEDAESTSADEVDDATDEVAGADEGEDADEPAADGGDDDDERDA